MKYPLFSIYDKKALMFQHPYCHLNIGSAIRQFGDLVQSTNNVAKHADDYALYHIGYFNDEDTVLTSENPIKLIAQASEFSPVTPPLQLIKNKGSKNEVSNEPQLLHNA